MLNSRTTKIPSVEEKNHSFVDALLDIVSFILFPLALFRICKRPKETAGSKITMCIFYMIFYIYSLSVILTIFWGFIQSVRTNSEFFDSKVGWPSIWHWENYSSAYSTISYNGVSFIGMFFNSLWFSVGYSILSSFFTACTGYVFAKYKFFGKEFFFSFIMFTIALPVVGTLPSLYKIIYSLKLNDSPLILVTALGGFGGNFLITYAFFKGLSNAYAEAAEIDGAGPFKTFFSIMLPQAIGPLFAITLITIIAQWNNYETPLLFLDKMPTLSSGLYRFSVTMKFHSNYPVYFAGVLLSIIPVLLLVALFGKKIMTNVSTGGIKG